MSKGIVIVPEYVKSQIDYLHLTYPNKEWSGILAYITKKGNFNSISDFEFEVIAVYPMDLGKPSYTEFEYNGAIADLYAAIEAYGYSVEEVKTGMIHSHHNMKAYFSGTDMDELRTNAKKHNYYLSLVVNVDEEYAAKVAFPTKVEVKELHKILDDKGEYIVIPKEKTGESYIIADLDIEIEGAALDQWFTDRINTLKEENNKPVSGYGRSYGRDWDSGWKKDYNSLPTAYSARTWQPPSTQQSLFENVEKKVVLPSVGSSLPETNEKEQLKIEDFLLELATLVYETSFISLQSFVAKSMNEPGSSIFNDSAYFDKANKVFEGLFAKHFGKAPKSNGEAEDIITYCLLTLEEIEGDMIGSGMDFEALNLLDEFKTYLYEQVP